MTTASAAQRRSDDDGDDGGRSPVCDVMSTLFNNDKLQRVIART